MICATIYLTTAGEDTGNFSLYSDTDSFTTAFETNVSRADLVSGYYSNLVPDGTTEIRVQSGTICTGYVDVEPAMGFTTEWTVSGDAAARTIVLPAGEIIPGTMYGTIYWGDGNETEYTDGSFSPRTHTYNSDGVYNVEIRGEWPHLYFPSSTDRLKLTDIIHWGNEIGFGGFSQMTRVFFRCENLKTTGEGSMIVKPTLTTPGYTFGGCTLLTGITENIFDNWVTVCPSAEFEGCTNLTYIPTGLFDSLTGSTGMWGMFKDCTSLETIPDGLLREMTSSVFFGNVFHGCTKLELNPWTFYYSGETSTRFHDQAITFSQTFYRTSYSGTTGTAPDLWNCDFGSATPLHTNTFDGAGNNETSIDNYASIPSAWGGPL